MVYVETFFYAFDESGFDRRVEDRRLLICTGQAVLHADQQAAFSVAG
jgi:hypothetical protein